MGNNLNEKELRILELENLLKDSKRALIGTKKKLQNEKQKNIDLRVKFDSEEYNKPFKNFKKNIDSFYKSIFHAYSIEMDSLMNEVYTMLDK